MTRRYAARTFDYTKMELGRVTRTYKGKAVCIIARCPKCGKKGERSVRIPPKAEGLRGYKPYVSVNHVMEIKHWPKDVSRALPMFGSSYGNVTESCSIQVNAENKDDLLSVAERREYDEFVGVLRAYVESF